MDPLEWMLEFVDRLSAPAKQMAQAVRGLVGNLRDLEKLFERLTAKARSFESMLRRTAQTAATFQKAARAVEGALRGPARAGPKGGGSLFGKSDFEALARAAQKQEEKLAAQQWKNIARAEAARVKAEKATERAMLKESQQQWKNIARAEAARVKAEKATERVSARSATKAAREQAKEAERIARGGTAGTTVTYKQAKRLFQGDAGQNFEVLKSKLSGMGVSAMDSSLLMRKLRVEIEGSRKEAMQLGGGTWLDRFRRNIWTLSHALNVFKTVASGVYDVLKDVFEVGKAGVGGFLKNAEFRENTLTSFTEMLRPFHGENAGAEGLKLFKRAQKFAVETPMETEDVVKGYQSFLGGGVDPLHVEKMFASSADVFAKFGKEAYESFLHGMIKMQSQGTTTKDALSEMAQGSHLDLSKVYAYLGKMSGFKGDEDKVREQVLKKLGKGEYHASAGQYAAMMTMSGGTEDFGGFAKKQSQTLTGTLSTLKSAISDLLQSVDLSDWAGMKELKATVLWLTDQLKPGTAYGERLLVAIQRVINALFGGLKGIRESGIEGLIVLIEKASLVIEGALTRAWEAIGKVSTEGMGSIEKMLEGAGELIGTAVGKALAAALPIIVAEVVKAIPGIIAGTFKGAWGAGTGLGKQFQQAAPTASSVIRGAFFGPAMAADWLGQKVFGSPTESSALQAYSGKPRGTMSMAPAPTDAPVQSFDSGGVVPGPFGRPRWALVRGGERYEGMGSPSVARGQGGGGGNTIVVHNHIGAEDEGDPDSMKRAVNDGTLEGVFRALERVAASQGLR